jgi:hypothetical protein
MSDRKSCLIPQLWSPICTGVKPLCSTNPLLSSICAWQGIGVVTLLKIAQHIIEMTLHDIQALLKRNWATSGPEGVAELLVLS